MTTIAVNSRGLAWRSLLLEARCEFLRMLRTPGFVVPTLLFPLMFYLLFGVLLGGNAKSGYDASRYLLASYCVFGVMSPGLFGFGVVVALERERGLLRLKRALPMPPQNYLLAKLAMAMVFAAVIFVALGLLAVMVGGVHLAAMQWLQLAMTTVLGVLPFCALGLLIGTLVGAQGAPAVVNLIYLPMAFLAGVAIPLFAMPAVVQNLAPIWPAYHLSQLAHAAIGQPAVGEAWQHVGVLAAFALVCFAIARRRLARAE
jgi:ABC-2 type transport system permease protein